jgi:hypothetical protein
LNTATRFSARRFGEKFWWKSVSQSTYFQDSVNCEFSPRFVAFDARTTRKQRVLLALGDEYAGYRVDSLAMAKISKISQDPGLCGGIEGARTIRLAITRLSTITCLKRITKIISLKTITFR